MSSKKWLLGACGVFAGALAVQSASASLLIDLEIANSGGKAQTVQKGDTVTIDIFATVRGANTTSTNDGFQSLQGSLKASGGAIIGVLNPAGDDILDPDSGEPTGQKFFGIDPFSGNGTTNGKQQDLDNDGTPDWGGQPSDATGIGDFLALRSNSMVKTGGTPIPDGQGGPAGRMFKIGSFDFVVGGGAGGDEHINFYPRLLTNGSKAQSTALWQEDTGTGAKDGSTGDLQVGGDVVLSLAAVPEPASLAALGLAAVGLLARRRRS
jgi:hypothetical protein